MLDLARADSITIADLPDTARHCRPTRHCGPVVSPYRTQPPLPYLPSLLTMKWTAVLLVSFSFVSADIKPLPPCDDIPETYAPPLDARLVSGARVQGA